MKTKLNLIDDSFSHDLYAVAGQNSEYIEWDRTLSQEGDFYFSNTNINDVVKLNTPREKSIGLIFESQAIIESSYTELENNITRFKKVYTHSSKLLSKYSNCEWIPGGGIWIGGSHGRGSMGIKKQVKNMFNGIFS